MVLLFMVFFVRHLVVEKQHSIVSFKYLVVYTFFLCISFAAGVSNGSAFEDIKIDLFRFLYPILCFYLCCNILDSTDKNIFMIWTVFIACVVKALLLDVSYVTGHGQPYDDYTIVTMDSAVLMGVGIMISLVFALALRRNRIKGFPAIFFMLLPLLFAVVFSFRRAHWVGQFLSLVFLFGYCPRELKKKFASAVLACLAMVIFTYLAVSAFQLGKGGNSPTLLSRVASIADSGQHSNKHHFLESATTLRDILRKPVLGMGLGGVHSPVPDSLIDWPNEEQPLHVVHNTFLHVWMKLGLPGLFFLIWAAAAFVKRLVVYRKTPGQQLAWPYIAGVGSGVGILLPMFLTGPVPWYFHQTMLIAMFSALCLNLIRLDTTKPDGVSQPRSSQ